MPSAEASRLGGRNNICPTVARICGELSLIRSFFVPGQLLSEGCVNYQAADLASAAFLIWHLNVIQSLVNMIGGSDNEKENFYRMCNSIGNTAG